MVALVAQRGLERRIAKQMGERVRALRIGRDWTQGQLATYASAEDRAIDRSWVSLLERGELPNPGGLRLSQIARALGVTADYLFTGIAPVGGLSMPVEPGKAGLLYELSEYSEEWLRAAASFLRSATEAAGHSILNEERANRERRAEICDQADTLSPPDSPT